MFKSINGIILKSINEIGSPTSLPTLYVEFNAVIKVPPRLGSQILLKNAQSVTIKDALATFAAKVFMIIKVIIQLLLL